MTTEATPGALGSNAKLGPLPEPAFTVVDLERAGVCPACYTADQMRAYAAQERAAERDRWKGMLICAVAEAMRRTEQGHSPKIKVDDKGWWCEW